MIDRLPMLRQLAASKPDEPFAGYGLAMELVKRGDGDEAKAVFAELVERHPAYVATYLMYGNLLVTQGDTEAARTVYDQGIGVAEAAADEHTASELVAAKAELP